MLNPEFLLASFVAVLIPGTGVVYTITIGFFFAFLPLSSQKIPPLMSHFTIRLRTACRKSTEALSNGTALTKSVDRFSLWYTDSTVSSMKNGKNP